jgi:hypothetical protein
VKLGGENPADDDEVEKSGDELLNFIPLPSSM